VKHRKDGGAWCPRDTGGCGKNFNAEDAPKRERRENPEPYELVNTIKKMAQKRALVAAVLIATGGSGIWTDIEDMPSVAGEGQIIDVTPPRDPEPPKRQKPSTQLADDKAWDEWVKLCSEADAAGIEPPELSSPMGMVQLRSEYVKLRRAIKDKQGAAAPSQATAQSSDGPEDSRPSGPSDTEDVEF
jgi:hypothetical protein